MQYHSGELVQRGDRVRLHGEDGQIDFIVDRETGDQQNDWYLRTSGPGVMILSGAFGSVYLRDPHEKARLVFVSRSSGDSTND
jgi:hypothetical protein